MHKHLKTILIWFLLGLVFMFFHFYVNKKTSWPTKDYSTFMHDISREKVSSVKLDNNSLKVKLYGKSKGYNVVAVLDNNLMQLLADKGVFVEDKEEAGLLTTLITSLLPLIFIVSIWLYFMRKSSTSCGGYTSLLKSKARSDTKASQITFAQVGGCDEAKQVLGDLVDFLKFPERWQKGGARLPHGILLEGSPGTGKTLLARAVAGEAQAQFFYASASEFVEMFIGVGAARVRDLFENAKKKAPSLIFIDELDAVGKRRGSGVGIGNEEREQTLNQLLACMDGFELYERVVVIGATNRSDVLDKALTRPGRFDYIVKIPSLNTLGRLEVLNIHFKNKPISKDVNVEELSMLTEGFTGSQLEGLSNEAAILAVRRARSNNETQPLIQMEDFRQVTNAYQRATSTVQGVDSVIIDSASQFVKPVQTLLLSLTLENGTIIKGALEWANASYIKLLAVGTEVGIIVAKDQIKTIQAILDSRNLEGGSISQPTLNGHGVS